MNTQRAKLSVGKLQTSKLPQQTLHSRQRTTSQISYGVWGWKEGGTSKKVIATRRSYMSEEADLEFHQAGGPNGLVPFTYQSFDPVSDISCLGRYLRVFLPPHTCLTSFPRIESQSL